MVILFWRIKNNFVTLMGGGGGVLFITIMSIIEKWKIQKDTKKNYP